MHHYRVYAYYMFANSINTNTAISCPNPPWNVLFLIIKIKSLFQSTMFSNVLKSKIKLIIRIYLKPSASNFFIISARRHIPFWDIWMIRTIPWCLMLKSQLLFVQPVFSNIFIFVCTTNTRLLPFILYFSFLA